MRNIKCRHTSVANGLLDGHQNVDLRSHIKRSRRLIKHHKIRLRTERQRRHTALQLPTRNLMRIAPSDTFRLRQSKLFKQYNRARLGLGLGEFPMSDRSFRNLFQYLLCRVEARSRRLAHIGNFPTTQGAQIALGGFQDVAPIDPDFAARQLNAAAPIRHAGEANGRLASAGLSNQAQHFSFLQIKRNTVHNLDIMRLFSGRIDCRPDLEVTYFDKRFSHPRPPFRLVVRFNTQSATRFTLIASVAIAIAG